MCKDGYGLIRWPRRARYDKDYPQERFLQEQCKIMSAYLNGIFDLENNDASPIVVTCPECDGYGQVEYDCYNISAQKEIDCPICEGDGDVALWDLQYLLCEEDFIWVASQHRKWGNRKEEYNEEDD